MVMKQTSAGWIWCGGAVICVMSALLSFLRLLPLWISAALIICAFPLTVLALFFWWMAGDKGGDIPFIGY